MEPNKLENEIREKLRSREVEPSAQAWDRLDAMLSVSEIQQEKKKTPWLYIAAGLVLFMGIGLFYIGNEKQPSIQGNPNTQVVSVSKEAIPEQQKSEEFPEHTTLKNEVVQGKSYVDVSSKSNVKASPKSVVPRVKQIREKTNKKLEIILNKEALAQQNMSVQTKEEIAFTPSENKMILPEKKENVKAKLKVDPSSLLSQVEDEEELTFKQKAIKVITKNYKNAKESLATRNLEQSSY